VYISVVVKIIIGFFGSRYGCNEEKLKQKLKELKNKYPELKIIVGDAKGVDHQVYTLCKKMNINVKVFKVFNNWDKISYQPEEDDVIKIVGSREQTLRVRLAMRTVELVKFVKKHGGFLVGCNVNGKGSQLALKTASKLGVEVDVIEK